MPFPPPSLRFALNFLLHRSMLGSLVPYSRFVIHDATAQVMGSSPPCKVLTGTISARPTTWVERWLLRGNLDRASAALSKGGENQSPRPGFQSQFAAQEQEHGNLRQGVSLNPGRSGPGRDFLRRARRVHTLTNCFAIIGPEPDCLPLRGKLGARTAGESTGLFASPGKRSVYSAFCWSRYAGALQPGHPSSLRQF